MMQRVPALDARIRLSRRPLAGVLAALLAAQFLASPAYAQRKPSAAPKQTEDRLDQRLRDAEKAFQQRDFARALELYRQVDAIESKVTTRLKMADCMRELGQLPEAYEAFAALLRDAGSSMERRDFERVEQSLASLQAATATLVVQVTEPDARVTIDGADFGSGPLDRSLRRKPGRAVLAVTKTGFQPWTRELMLRAGEEQRVSVDLVREKTTGTLVVRTPSKGPTTLLLDGKEIGPLPWTGEVLAGEHELSARNARGESVPRRVTVSPQGQAELELTVVELPAKLRVTTADPVALINLDGTLVGTGSFEGEVAPGKHVVSVERQGFVPKVTSLTVEPGETTALHNVVLDRVGATGSAGHRPDYQGLYLRVGLAGLFGRPTHSISTGCPATDGGGTCQSWLTSGGEVDVRVGYSFGLMAAEAFALGGTTVSIAHMGFPRDVLQGQSSFFGIARSERYFMLEPGAGGGLAARISSRTEGVRLSAAWGAGLEWRYVELGREVDARPVSSPDSVWRRDVITTWTGGGSRLVPLLVWEADVELGDTPGRRLFIGLNCQLEFGSNPFINPGNGRLGVDTATGQALPLGGGSIEVRRGPVFYLGPKLGLVVGH
jgi:hypothetical protein